MIYHGTVVQVQKSNLKFTAWNLYEFMSLTKKLSDVDFNYKPVGPTMLVEWLDED